MNLEKFLKFLYAKKKNDSFLSIFINKDSFIFHGDIFLYFN